MMEIEYPSMRIYLEGYLEDLSNPLIQWRCWIRKEPYPGFPHRIADFSDTANNFLDMFRFGYDEEGEAVNDMFGVVLKTPEEVEAVRRLGNALSAVIDATGRMAPYLETITHPLWADVLTTAREAMDAYCRAEFEVFPPVKPQK